MKKKSLFPSFFLLFVNLWYRQPGGLGSPMSMPVSTYFSTDVDAVRGCYNVLLSNFYQKKEVNRAAHSHLW